MRCAVGALLLWSIALPSFAGVLDGRIRSSVLGDIAVVPTLGVFIPSDSRVDSTVTVGGDARFQLYAVDEGLSIGVGMGYAAPSRPGAGQITVVPIQVNAVYEVFLLGQTTELSFSGGVGIYPWEAVLQGSSDSGVSLGLQAGVGIEPKWGPGNPVAEVGYSYANAQFPSRGIVGLGGITLRVGYRFIF